MPANLAHLQIFLSGGAANTDTTKSLGGPISSTRVLSQSATAPSTITGVTIEDAAGNAEGSGTLTYTYSATAPTLQWTPPGGSIGAAVDVSAGGKFAVQGASNGGVVFVSVVVGSLPGSNQTNSITIANQVNKVWDDVSKAESLAGRIEYRCLYIKNTHNLDPMVDVRVWRSKDTDGQDVLAVALDSNAASTTPVSDNAVEATKVVEAMTWTSNTVTVTITGHGYATGDLVLIAGVTPTGYNGTYAITVTDADTFTYALATDPGAVSVQGTSARYSEIAEPVGPDFTVNAISETSSIVVGDLQPGEARAFWERRTVPSNTTVATAKNHSRLGLRVYV